MRHTVIGIFDTYDQAEVARNALVASGFARSDIELQAAPAASSPDDPASAAGAGEPYETGGVLANIERFFSMLFGRDQPPEVAHYSEAVRRGGVLVAVDTANAARADAARQTLAEQGAIDIDERAASWGTLSHGRTRAAGDDDRDHSLLDELGLGTGSAVPGRAPVNPPADPIGAARADANRARAYPRADRDDPAMQPLDPISPVARDLFAGGSDSSYRATGGDPMTSSTVRPDTNERVRRSASCAATSLDEPLAGGADAPNAAQSAGPADPLAGNDSASRSAAASEPPNGAASSQGWRAIDPLDPLDETETSSRMGAPSAVSAASAASVAGTAGAASSPIPGTLSQTGDSLLGTRAGTRSTMPDEYMEYEDEFRSDYESKYAATGASYEEYQEAYQYGVTAASDERYHRRNWDDTMETELRHDWEGRRPGGSHTWGRFKLAVRHGWERVTRHHHHQ